MNRNAKIGDVVTSADINLSTNKFKKVFIVLNEQYKIISFIVGEAFLNDITTWKKVTHKLPANIFRFCRRYLVFSLDNNSVYMDVKFTTMIYVLYAISCKRNYAFQLQAGIRSLYLKT